jgi:spore coat protein A
MTGLARRRFLGLAGGVGLGALGIGGLAGCGGGEPGQTGQELRSRLPLPAPFRARLPIPPVKQPVRRDADTDWYEIRQRPADVELLPGKKTRIVGYDGRFPGPTIESRRGRRTVVRHLNQTGAPTVVHLHGGHTPASSDGWPTDLVLPAGYPHPAGHAGDVTHLQRDYVYPVDQPAATLWYHDHRMDFSAPQVYRGLAGFHLIRDDVEDALPLPRGRREVPLMIADRSFEADGSLRYPAADPHGGTPGVEDAWVEGVLGDVILVNGAPWPELAVDAARYRFRVLNGSNARRYRLALDPAPAATAAFVQIGSDGGLLDRPVEHATLELAPAERFDLIVDFSGYRPGQTVTLRNELGTGGTGLVMRFLVGARARDDSQIPPTLARLERLTPGPGAIRRNWTFSRGHVRSKHHGWVINGKPFDPDRIDARPRLGEVELWTFGTDLHHPVHVHLAPFQVLSRGGHEPGPTDQGWKDTVDLRPAEYVEVAVRFTDYPGRFLIHCHNLEHEDMAMMATFETR